MSMNQDLCDTQLIFIFNYFDKPLRGEKTLITTDLETVSLKQENLNKHRGKGFENFRY